MKAFLKDLFESEVETAAILAGFFVGLYGWTYLLQRKP